MSFVHLHVHSSYSFLDSLITIDELVQTAKAMNMPAVALTDHGRMSGILEFYRAARAAGINPILGVEAFVAPDRRRRNGLHDLGHHLVLLAENREGYRNLRRLVSLADSEGFYHQPRVDKELLAAHGQGLIALSACLSGEIPSLLLVGREKAAKGAAEAYARLFPGRFYLELHRHGLAEEAEVNAGLAEIGRALGLPLAAANDCHYLRKEDSSAHDLLLCLQQGCAPADEDRFRFPSAEYYFKSPAEMAVAFPDFPEALANTLAIAERCRVELPAAPRRSTPALPAGNLPGQAKAARFKRAMKRRDARFTAALRRIYGPGA
jgi:DNA polymerase-3 subunit alpha